MTRDFPSRRRFRRPLLAALVAAALVLATSMDIAAAPVRHWIDQQEITRLTTRHPGAFAHLEKGEDLAMAGQTQQALAEFQDAGKNAPESSLIARRECQALTILGRRSEAVQACLRALKTEASAMDLRAMVAALMSGSEAPTTTELAQAMRLARRAVDSMPQEPWGYAAECDIAERIADARMLESCLADLQRVAPRHYETVRALAAAAPHGITWRVWAGWSAILLLALGTAAHALWRALSDAIGRRRSERPAIVSAALLLALSVGPSPWTPAHADATVAEAPAANAHKGMLSDWAIDDNDPESSVPSDHRRDRNPLQFGYWLMDLAYKGVQATKRGDHYAAIKFYKAMVKAVPDRSVSFTRLCESYEAAGDWKNAVETCATALTRPGVTVNDYQHYFKLALAKNGALTGAEIEILSNVIQHVRDDPSGHDLADDLECQLGVRLEDVSRLQKCTAALAARAPDDPKTLSYEWALALKRGNMKEAAAVLERARSTEMKPEGIEQMERGMASAQAIRRRRLYALGLGGLAIIAGAGLAALFATRRRGVARATS
jgi:tetratricopeptide (TPR) repeat protein